MRKIMAFLVIVLLVACTSPAALTATPTDTEALTPVYATLSNTPTFSPTIKVDLARSVTSTPIVTITPQVIMLKPGHHYMLPNGLTEKPLSIWKDIPVMPSATFSFNSEKGYYFFAKSTLEETQEYYNKEMTQRGWILDSVINIIAGSSLDRVELTFKKGIEDQVSVLVMPQSENLMYIILVWNY